jgi:hypothetical protein
MDSGKKVEISSLETRFNLLHDASALRPLTSASTLGRVPGTGVSTSPVSVSAMSSPISRSPTAGRFVSVSVSSSAKTATVVYKPTQVAHDDRQERMNKIIRHGFVQGVRTTTK